MDSARRANNQFHSTESTSFGVLDRTIHRLEIHRSFRVRRPVTMPAEVQTTLDVSQKGSHKSSLAHHHNRLTGRVAVRILRNPGRQNYGSKNGRENNAVMVLLFFGTGGLDSAIQV